MNILNNSSFIKKIRNFKRLDGNFWVMTIICILIPSHYNIETYGILQETRQWYRL